MKIIPILLIMALVLIIILIVMIIVKKRRFRNKTPVYQQRHYDDYHDGRPDEFHPGYEFHMECGDRD